MKKKPNELSIKSKLLFNSLDMQYKVAIELNNKDEKRIKAINAIFQTYLLTVRPFISDMGDLYQQNIVTAINNIHEEINRMVYERATADLMILKLSPILNHLKDMISTCKMNTNKLEELWKIA